MVIIPNYPWIIMIFPAKKNTTTSGQPWTREKAESRQQLGRASRCPRWKASSDLHWSLCEKVICPAKAWPGRESEVKKMHDQKISKMVIKWDLMEIQTFWAFLISGISFKADAAEKKSFFLKMWLFNLMLLGAQRMHSLIRLYVKSGRGLCVSI